MKRVGVLGTLIWDRIWPFPADRAARPREAWGGVAYALAAVAATLPAGWRAAPLIKLGRDLEPDARRLLGTIGGLELDRMTAVPEPNNRVELRYHDPARRCERLTGGVPPWRWSELRSRLVGLDALLVNFISGFELELATMERLRAGFDGPIYGDIHSLMLAREPDGRRSLRPLPDRDRWLACFDALQLNGEELILLATGSADASGFARAVAARAAGLVLVTEGADGARWFRREGFPADPLRWRAAGRGGAGAGPAVIEGRVGAAPMAGDPTGCGDVWGGACFAALLGGQEVEAAVRTGHAAAARKLGHVGAEGLYERLDAAGAAG